MGFEQYPGKCVAERPNNGSEPAPADRIHVLQAECDLTVVFLWTCVDAICGLPVSADRKRGCEIHHPFAGTIGGNQSTERRIPTRLHRNRCNQEVLVLERDP